MPPGYSDARKAAFAAAHQALTTDRTPSEAARAAARAAHDFLAAVAIPLNLTEAMAHIACDKGCWWCCCQMVGVTSAELEMVQEAVARLSPEDHRAVADKIAEVNERSRGLDQAGWWKAKIPCPLLSEQGMCRVHADRPFSCRAHNSADKDSCRRSFEGEAVQAPALAAQRGIFAHAQAGLADAMAEAGYPPVLILLTEGLAARLISPTAP